MANFDELLESVVDYNEARFDELFTEGANLEIRDKYKALRKEYKALNKKIKEAKKSGETDKIEKTIDEYLELMKKTRKEIDNTPETVGSVIAGFFIAEVMDFCEIFLATVVSLPLAGIGGTIDSIKILIQEIAGIVRQYKKVNKGEFSIEMLNIRRAKLNSVMDSMESYLKKVKKGLNDTDDVKESVEDIKLNIYESCHAGEITEEERDILLDIVE